MPISPHIQRGLSQRPDGDRLGPRDSRIAGQERPGHRPATPDQRQELSREFKPTAQSIANWVHQADRDAGRRSDGATAAEREELIRFRRENQRLRQERDILSKAAAWFARES
ncbi:MAG: hypothetical protein DI537_16170, partial [Stutzerimonas stutzeri]